MNQMGILDEGAVKDGRVGTLEELMEGKAFSCKGIYPKEVIRAFQVNQNQAGGDEEKVHMEDIGSDWDEEEIPENNRRRGLLELKTSHSLDQLIPKIEQVREVTAPKGRRKWRQRKQKK